MSDKKHCAKAGCGKDLSGGYITAGEKFYCQGHFQCAVCEKDLHNTQYYDWEGKTVCAEDFAKSRGFVCAKCGHVIAANEKAITAMEKKWHTGCFVCANCKGDLGSGSFFVKNDQPWCEKCGKN